MSEKTEQASAVYAPTDDLSAPHADQYLANTGTTESVNSTALLSNQMATLVVGNTAVRVTFRGTGGLATQVTPSGAGASMIIGANQRFDWVALPNQSTFVYVEAADGASAYEAWVWTSSP